MPLGCQVAWHSYRAWESRGYGCWGMVRLTAKGMKQPGCINLVERLVPLLKVQLVITRFLLIGTKRTSKPCILCTQPCSSRPCWYSSSLWSGRKEALLDTHLHAYTAGEQWGILRGAQAEPRLPSLESLTFFYLLPVLSSDILTHQKYIFRNYRVCSSALLLFSPDKYI